MVQRIKITTLLLFTFSSAFCQTHRFTTNQAQQVVETFKRKGLYPVDGRDTMLDLNRDGYKDLLFEFYGLSGTGEKNAVRVYLFDSRTKKFQESDQLNHLANPTFYLNKKLVLGYYMGNGGGTATKLKWNGLRLDTLEHININVIKLNGKLAFELHTYDYVTKKKSSQTLEKMNLPEAYRYMNYHPLIKRSSRQP